MRGWACPATMHPSLLLVSPTRVFPPPVTDNDGLPISRNGLGPEHHSLIFDGKKIMGKKMNRIKVV